jgi:carbon-monoxide dehydrogenase small subunit
MTVSVAIKINGREHKADVPIRMLLVDFIRDVAKLTGTHVGCTYEGVCGACTVQLDGEAVKSCMMLACQADGRAVTTVEGLAEPDGTLHPLQTAFRDRHALQCGYCTSGVLMNADEFLRQVPDPSDAEIRRALIGNLCRCTGYTHIVQAIRQAAVELRARDRKTVIGQAAE